MWGYETHTAIINYNMNSLGNLVLRHVAREEIVALTEYRSLQYDWAVYTILLCLHPLVCLCNFTKTNLKAFHIEIVHTKKTALS